MSERVVVEFQVTDREKFLMALQCWDEACDRCDTLQTQNNGCISFRADDYVSKRQALVAFVDKMEEKLRKNEHKKNWREKPVEALFKLLMLEIREFKVAFEFFSIEEARTELVDAANFCMMVHDRLGMLDQERNFKEQHADEIRPDA
jgi:hypothetical protein